MGSSTGGGLWRLLRDSIAAFIDDGALSMGAAIAFYSVTSMAPVLLIVVAIAGLVFGGDAAQNAITGQVAGLMGEQSAAMLQTALRSASGHSAGVLASVIGAATLLVTASGVFGELQSSLNAIWKVEATGTTLSRTMKARAASLGLVAALGFLLIVSLVVSAALSALSGMINAVLPFGALLLGAISFVVSYALTAVLFGAIYKVLPDRPLAWRDVVIGALTTALLFTAGKSLIGLYLGSSAMASSYGAASAFMIILLWVYYSAQIFLLGAEFTKVYSLLHGSNRGKFGAGPAPVGRAPVGAVRGGVPHSLAPHSLALNVLAAVVVLASAVRRR